MSTDALPIPSPTPEPTAKLSPVARMIGMFFTPKPTFEDIVRKPDWILPLALIVGLSFVSILALNMHFDWRSYMVQQMDKNPSTANLSADQKQQQVEAGSKYAPIFAYVFGIPLPILAILVIALVLMGLYNLMAGAGVNFSTSFSIVCYSIATASIVGTFLFLLVLFLKPVGTFNLDNPVATNVAAFFSDDSPKWLMALGKNIDLLDIWKMILIGLGFSVVNPKKLKGAKPYMLIFGIFIVYVILRVGISFAFS
jgi:hypothetical protein